MEIFKGIRRHFDKKPSDEDTDSLAESIDKTDAQDDGDDSQLSWAEQTAQEIELYRDIRLEVELHGLFIDSGKEPMIFGSYVGESGFVDDTFFRAMDSRIQAEQIDQFIRGCAHSVAMADLQLDPYVPQEDKIAHGHLAVAEEHAYQYLKTVVDFRNAGN